MTLRCKPGDIARIVGLPEQLNEANDRIVRCIELVMLNSEPAWRLEERVNFVVVGNCTCRGQPFFAGTPAFFDTLQDKYLRPLRDPGDDAQDEMLRPLPRKATTTEHTHA